MVMFIQCLILLAFFFSKNVVSPDTIVLVKIVVSPATLDLAKHVVSPATL